MDQQLFFLSSIDQKWTQIRPKWTINGQKTDHICTNKLQQITKNMTDVRADVLNPMMFKNAVCSIKYHSLYILDVLVVK